MSFRFCKLWNQMLTRRCLPHNQLRNMNACGKSSETFATNRNMNHISNSLSIRKAKRLTNSFIVQLQNHQQSDLPTGRVLLGKKKRGFGVGLWNGFGGKIEPGETELEAAQREFFEECNVRMADPSLIGKVTYRYAGMPHDLHVSVFRATHFSLEECNGKVSGPMETEEMYPSWFEISHDIPFDKMWPDDRYWFTSMLIGEPFIAFFEFAEDMREIIQKEVRIAPNIQDLDFLS